MVSASAFGIFGCPILASFRLTTSCCCTGAPQIFKNEGGGVGVGWGRNILSFPNLIVVGCSTAAQVMLSGFAMVINKMGTRVRPYLPQIGGTIKWRLNNKDARVRQQSADLISRIAKVMQDCQEEQLMCHMGVVLYEYLGEEYPEVWMGRRLSWE